MASAGNRQKRIERMQRLRTKILEWAGKQHGEALQAGVRCWLGSSQPTKDRVQEALLFALIAPGEDGLSLSDRYRDGGDELSRFEREIFEVWSGVRFSIFEIASVNEGVGFEMRDLIRDQSLQIREKTASKSVKHGDCMAAFVKHIDRQDELEGTVVRLKGAARTAAIDTLTAALGDGGASATPEATRRAAFAVITAVRAAESARVGD